MSAQTTVNQPVRRLRAGWIGASILATAAIVASLALAAVVLFSANAPTTTVAAPTFDAPNFRQEERDFRVHPVFDAPGFRAEEKEPLR